MKIVFVLLLFYTVYGSELDIINEKIRNKHLDSVKSEISDFDDLLDQYHQTNIDQYKAILEKAKETQIDKKELQIDKDLYQKAKSKALQIKKQMADDKDFQRWIYKLTEDIYYREFDKKIDISQKKDIEKFASYIYYSVKKQNSFPLDQTGERIYIFLSSSVPESVWKRYIRDLRLLNNDNIYIVLRGCIGKDGCTYLKPTLRFIRRVAFTDDPGVDTTKPVNIILDPFLFRYYQIKLVPSFVYAKGVYPLRQGVTEGLDVNLKQKVEDFYLLKGDVSLYFFVSKLIDEERINSKFLKEIQTILSFQND